MHADVYDNMVLLIYKHHFGNDCFTTNQCDNNKMKLDVSICLKVLEVRKNDHRS